MSQSRIHLIGPETATDDLPRPVLSALRAIRNVREEQLARLTDHDRQTLAEAEHAIAWSEDLHSQINRDRSG